jgi:hypothetical protein
MEAPPDEANAIERMGTQDIRQIPEVTYKSSYLTLARD